MLLILPEDVRQKLKPLESLSTEVAQEFCRISIEFFKGNVKSKTLRSAENKLSLPEGSVESCVTALLYLLKEAGQRELTEAEFAASIACLRLEPDVRDVLVAYYQGNLDNPALRLRAGDQAPPTERKGQWAYNGLDWRLDLEVASKGSQPGTSLSRTPKPLFLMNLKLKNTDPNSTEQDRDVLLQTDVPTLKEMVRRLEEASRQLSGPEVKRMARILR